MRMLAYARSLAARFFRRARLEADLQEELRSHIQLRADDLERSGLNPADAERRAGVEFGGRERFREESREAVGGNLIETQLLDVRYSLRVLRKSPGFTAVAIVTLALAIGANATVFGVMNRLILRPLSVPDAESLYGIEHGHEHNMAVSYPDYLDLRDRNRSFDGLAAYDFDQVAIDTGDASTRAWITVASGNYFDVLRIDPYLGRFFHSSDERGLNSAPYVVLSYDCWRNRFHGDAGVVGHTVRLNTHPFTIVGVAPAEFRGTLVFVAPEFYVPMVNREQFSGTHMLNVRRNRSVFMAFGHLKRNVTADQAASDLNSIGAYFEKTYPKEHGATTFVLARPGLYGNYLGTPVKAFIAGLTLLSALILLAACANLASLFGARAADRSREVALRLALGGGRARILRQFLTEAVLVSMAGGALGLWGSIFLLRALSVWHPFPKFPITVPATPDANVWVMALLLALVSGLLFGMVPVRQVLRTNPYQIVKAGPSGTAGRKLTPRDVVLVTQIAICAVLVTASMVAIRGMARSLHTNVGFEPRNALLADTDLNMAGYTPDRVLPMQKRILEAVQTIPGVTSAALGRPPITEEIPSAAVFSDATTDFRPSNEAATVMRFVISPGFFDAAETSLVAGRAFTWHDDKGAPRVAVVNRTFASRLFGSTGKALGGKFKLSTGVRMEVVGVVEDGKYTSLTEDQLPAIFLPLAQVPTTETWIVVRSSRDPEQLASAIRITLRGLDPALPVYAQAWSKQLDFALFPSRVATAALAVLGVMGAMLSVTGIFGMAAYSVSRRLKELGIRMALGAQRKELLQAALGRAVRLLLYGSAAGVVLGVLASRVLASIVYQATPRDPLVVAGVAGVMLLLGVVATWIPARRALSIDPLVLLREE